MAQVKLMGSTKSLFCTRIEWALKLKGIEYEYIEEDLGNRSELLLKSNPIHKKVPVLLHHDKSIPESLVILEYIEETWKDNNPLLPQDPYQTAQTRFWAKFADEKCIYGTLGACLAEGEEEEKAIESALESLNFLEKQIEGKEYFGGEQIGLMDLVAGWIPYWLNVMEEAGGGKQIFNAERFPSLHQWGQNFTQIPFVKECLPPRQELLAYFNACITYMRSLASKTS